jgi:16S rRNA (uracil1498-N3)-methyltransferase
MTGRAQPDAIAPAAPRFFCPQGPRPADLGQAWTLPEAVAHHAVRVLRLVPQDAVTLFDGTGGEYSATLARADRREAVVRVDAFVDADRESPLHSVLVQALPANDAMDYAVRKAVETGVTAIQPVTSQRSARFPEGERGEKRIAHWRQIVVAACEQCGRNRVPDVRPVRPLAEWLAARDRTALGFVLAPEGAEGFADPTIPATRVEILVGPEGGLAPRETAVARDAGMSAVRLGPRVLRTETAGVAMLAVLQSRWGDWR